MIVMVKNVRALSRYNFNDDEDFILLSIWIWFFYLSQGWLWWWFCASSQFNVKMTTLCRYLWMYFVKFTILCIYFDVLILRRRYLQCFKYQISAIYRSQNYIPDVGYRVIYRDMVLNTERHTGWRICMCLPT